MSVMNDSNGDRCAPLVSATGGWCIAGRDASAGSIDVCVGHAIAPSVPCPGDIPAIGNPSPTGDSGR